MNSKKECKRTVGILEVSLSFYNPFEQGFSTNKSQLATCAYFLRLIWQIIPIFFRTLLRLLEEKERRQAKARLPTKMTTKGGRREGEGEGDARREATHVRSSAYSAHKGGRRKEGRERRK